MVRLGLTLRSNTINPPKLNGYTFKAHSAIRPISWVQSGGKLVNGVSAELLSLSVMPVTSLPTAAPATKQT
jgi:hypothetical protein